MKTKQDNSHKLSINSEEKWFKQIPETSSSNEKASPDVLIALKSEAQNYLDSEANFYQRMKENKKDKDFLWVKRILQAGTLSDKISAHTVMIQDSPVYNLNSLEYLINMVNTKGKRECLMAIDSLQDLFIQNLFKKKGKLQTFNERPLSKLSELSGGASTERKKFLILWEFEDRVISLYKKFLKCLDKVSHDTIEKTKMKAVNVFAKFLMEKPEEEQFLVEKLVNKIGDPIPKVGSHVCYNLGLVLQKCVSKKAVILQEVERLIYRPNLSERGKYYALCFLNEIILNSDEFAIANHLIMIYFGQLKVFMKKGEVDNKMMRALLTGVARAYPYAKLKDNVILQQLDAMYKIVHMVSFNISIQAMIVIFEVLDSSDSLSDRFYGVLYRKLLDPALASSSRQASMLHLLYRALKKDVALVRLKAFIKRLLQVSLFQEPNLQCGILFLISKLNTLHPKLMDFHNPFADSDSEEHYEDMPEEEDDESAAPTISKEPSRPKPKESVFDLDCRNPLHSNTVNQQLFDLLFLKRSFHPSVALFAHQVASSTEIKYSGDPLMDFTTSRFLDRFVYRNPKQMAESFHTDPKSKVFGRRKLQRKQSRPLAVTSTEYMNRSEDKIPCEELFLYRYLRKRAEEDVGEKEDDIESVCSEDFDKLMDNMNVESEAKDSLNFALELGLNKQKKKGVKRSAEDHSEDEELEDEDLDEEEMEFEPEDFEGEFGNLDEDICEEDFVGLGNSLKKSKNKQKNDPIDGDLLTAADEFSTLLEEGTEGGIDTTTSEAFRTKDKSSAKQLKWELERDRKLKNTGRNKRYKKPYQKFKKFKKS